MALSEAPKARELDPTSIEAKLRWLSEEDELFQKEAVNDRSDARYGEFLKNQIKAKTDFLQALELIKAGRGEDILAPLIQGAYECFEQCCSIRKELLMERLAKTENGQPMLSDEIDSLVDFLGDDDSKAPTIIALKELGVIARGMEKSEKNSYIRSGVQKNGRPVIGVDFLQLNKARKYIAEIEGIAAKNDQIFNRGEPEKIQSILRRFKTMTSMIESSNPRGAAMNEFNLRLDAGKGEFDTRPLRILGFGSGVLFASFGIYRAIKDKSAPTLPTYGWATAAALCGMPNLLNSRGTQAVKDLHELADAKTNIFSELNGYWPFSFKDLMNVAKFHGKNGEKAFEEICDLSDKDKNVQNFMTSKKIGLSQLQFVVKDDSALYKAMAELKTDEERSAVFRLLYGLKGKKNLRGVIASLIKTRDDVNLG